MKSTNRFSRGSCVSGLALACIFLLGGDATAQTCVPTPSGLVSWWPGEGNANDFADANHGALQGGATFGPGMVGQAFSFDGVDDFVLVPDSPSLNPTNAITVDSWVYVTGKQGQHRDIISKDGESFDRQYLLTASSVNRFRAHVGVPAGFLFFDGRTPVEVNRWYHVAMTYDGSSLKLYVNGVLDGARNVTGAIITTTQSVRIGGGAAGSAPPLHFPGLVDEVEIHNQALDGSEIAAIFSAGSAGKCNLEIDIKPGSDPNSINLASSGVIPVAILSSETFDAPSQVAPDALLLAGTPVRVVGKGNRFLCHIEDVNGDGLADLVCQFENVFDAEPGDTRAGVTGKTVNGESIRGADSINIVP